MTRGMERGSNVVVPVMKKGQEGTTGMLSLYMAVLAEKLREDVKGKGFPSNQAGLR